MRTSGILLPISSLPSKYGIGCFSKEAYNFVDKLVKSGQTYWQILPLGMTSYGDSPYQSFSTFAGNPYFIDLEQLIKDGLLTKEDCEVEDFGDNQRYIDYGKMYYARYKVLKKAFENAKLDTDNDFENYCKTENYWLDDFSLFMAIKSYFGGKSFMNWDKDLQKREPKKIFEFKEKLKEDINFHKFLQYKFNSQWLKLKAYANDNGIKIIGDLPIYVSLDSSDVWASPELFQFDKNGNPTAVAGCPPDDFALTGQLWGNPLYNWEKHEETGFEWWITRMKQCDALYDVVRIDHFRGFDEYYSIPYSHPTAEFGTWEKGPGFKLFKAIQKKLGKTQVIAEDLGFITPSVRKLVRDCGYPGMKILEFAFYGGPDSENLPHNYTNDCIVYTGTHDNETLIGWYDGLGEKERKFASQYIGKKLGKNLNWDMIRTAMNSVADTCIIPMQDYLGLDNSARINTPATLGENWKWRMIEEEFSNSLARKIAKITDLSYRLSQKNKE